MLVIIDEREIVTSGYVSRFANEGISSTGFRPEEFGDWVRSAAETDLFAVEAFLLGDCQERQGLPKIIRERSPAPLIALNDTASLEQTLSLFAAGADDVVRKPVHVREILARVGAIKRRHEERQDSTLIGDLRVFFDGRDPEVKGSTLQLPRRERRILEYLVNNRGRRVSKTQIFNSIYGIFDEKIEENVVESHISKLRKKLRRQLGYDPINSVRYLGYCFEDSRV
ncbi:response regulator transcription factor [Beijerinckia indica]|uniref:Two component transcriptional regulator, winged helix family n=1 Tax=Beijerinckia indica subsp. indica (strain ATCC 9039 / DSM 1715 / NCIMB 8712) TaxID=395963 RepID=B2IEK2_BEII9|nr:response regulator transcription factor [Beijerinckia indica]ACB96944.1 two component transcriptional regulator, winged helix family [Beijerinckia indica subsp. indica ATCC 9039]